MIGRALPQSDIIGFALQLCLPREEADIIVSATKDVVESVLDLPLTEVVELKSPE